MDKEKAKKPSLDDVKVYWKTKSTVQLDNRGPMADTSTKEGEFWLDNTGWEGSLNHFLQMLNHADFQKAIDCGAELLRLDEGQPPSSGSIAADTGNDDRASSATFAADDGGTTGMDDTNNEAREEQTTHKASSSSDDNAKKAATRGKAAAAAAGKKNTPANAPKPPMQAANAPSKRKKQDPNTPVTTGEPTKKTNNNKRAWVEPDIDSGDESEASFGLLTQNGSKDAKKKARTSENANTADSSKAESARQAKTVEARKAADLEIEVSDFEDEENLDPNQLQDSQELL